MVCQLFFVATHCRDGSLRHLALEQLQKLPTRDGIWFIETIKQTAEICIRYEEALCDKDVPSPEDIPEWRRIHSAGFVGYGSSEEHPDKRTLKVQLRTRPNGQDGEWEEFVEEIER